MFKKVIYIVTIYILFLGMKCNATVHYELASNKLYDSIWLNNDKGKLEIAISLSQQFLALHDTTKHYKEQRLKIYNLLGYIYYLKYDMEESSKYYQLALQSSINSGFKAIVFGNIGNIYLTRGDFTKAILYYKKALFNADSMDFITRKINYHNLAIAYYKSASWNNSIQAIKKSIEINKNHNISDLGNNYDVCAVAYQKLGDLAKAKIYFRKSIESYKKTGDPNYYKLAVCYSDLADLLLDEGKYDQSRVMSEKAYKILLKTLGFKHPYTSDCLKTLGNIYYKEGDYPKALRYYQKALNARVKSFNDTSVYSNPGFGSFADPDLLTLLKLKADAFEKLSARQDEQNNLAAALSTLQLASAFIEKLRSGYMSQSSKLQLSGNEAGIYRSGIRIAVELYQLTNDRSYLDEAFAFSERGKYGILRELRGDVHARNFAGVPDSISEKDNQLAREISADRIFIEKENGKEKPDQQVIHTLYNKLFALTQEQDSLIKQLEVQYPVYYRMKYDNRVVDPGELQHYLKRNQALLEYAVQDSSVYIFVATKDTFALVVKAADTAFYHSLAYYTRFLHSFYSMQYPRWRRSSYTLYQNLIEPVESLLKNKELVVVPDDKLSLVSFEPFTTAPYRENDWHMYQQEPYLLYRYAISYAYSATLLVNSTNHKFSFWRNFIGFAPDYTNSPDSLDNIPEGLSSLRQISRMFCGKALIGISATEHYFKQHHNYNIINLYTHGEDDTLNPSLSRIFFSHDTSGGEDSYLHAYEIRNMQLKTNLVTLVSCYSGSGAISKGEGVMSLGRSFMDAGTPSMIISLWSASSGAAFTMMKEFYWQLLKGENKSEALRKAKINYIASANTVTANPQNWSELVLVGNTVPLFHHYFLKMLMLPVLVLILLLSLFLLRKKFRRFLRAD